MRLLVLSDTHLRHPGWGTFGLDVFARAREEVKKRPVDVVLHVGDLTEPSCKEASLEEGLQLLQGIPATYHLWVAGNNDIEFHLATGAPFKDYPVALHNIAVEFDVQLLDRFPLHVGWHSFVGNFGAYDLSLWRPPRIQTPDYPSTREELLAQAAHVPEFTGLTVAEMFAFCQDTLRKHLMEVIRGDKYKTVLATHTVPSFQMMLYGDSPAYDNQNAWMGWEDNGVIARHPGLVRWFCGHTHRDCEVISQGVPIQNISGKAQPWVFDL